MKTDERGLKRLKEIRLALLALNRYPEICSEYGREFNKCNEGQFPGNLVEKAYCNLLWQVDEAIRAKIKGDRDENE